MLIVGTVEVLNQTGQDNAIVRHPDPTREHYNSAWTISILLGVILGLLILAVRPLAVSYFHEPRASLVVSILAFRTMAMGFQNVGIVSFRRQLQFRKQFLFNVIPQIVSIGVTIACAFIIRNYWALVIGILAKSVTSLSLSYLMSSFRPKLSIAFVSDIWSFSTWTWLRSMAGFLATEVDKIAIGGFGGASAMGRYEVGTDVAISPTVELVNPLVVTLLPVLATVQHNKEKRRELYLSVLYWSALACTSTSVGVALVSSDMVDLVLGAKWHDVKPLIPWFALAYGVVALSSSVYSAFDTIGKPDVSARLQWTRLMGLALCILPVAYFLHDLRAIAITRLAVTVVITPTLFLALARSLISQFATLPTSCGALLCVAL